MIATHQITDLLVLSHGWKNGEIEASTLYTGLVKHIQNARSEFPDTDRHFGVVEIYWPSKRFNAKSRPNQGASLSASNQLLDLFDQFSLFFGEDEAMKPILQEARLAIEDLDDDSDAVIDLFRTLQQLLPGIGEPELDPMDSLIAAIDPKKGESLLRLLQNRPTNLPSSPSGGAALDTDDEDADLNPGAGAALGSAGELEKGFLDFLNNFTYYRMRKRAHTIGKMGLNPVLLHVKQDHSALKLHLIGHSFGALLVTSAILGSDENRPLDVDTLTLLQAAFSHFSFAQHINGGPDGFFRPVLSQVKGPLLISHSHTDTDIKNLYTIASYVAGQVAQNFGGKNSFYGGLGSNGAQETPESSDEFRLSWKVKNFQFKPKIVYNLEASALIKDHSDIIHTEIASAILSAIATT